MYTCWGSCHCVCLWVSPYLMVPVGEGSGEPNALMCSSCCCIVGMLILRGEMWGRRGRGGREGCSLSLCSSGSRSDINWILITVLGKRNTHLESKTAGGRDCESHGTEEKRNRQSLISAFSPIQCFTAKHCNILFLTLNSHFSYFTDFWS